MKIMVTGGAGFIGSTVIKYLLNHTAHRVINIDKLTYAATLQASDSITANSHYSFYKADICDANAISFILNQEQPDAVIHLAAETHVDRSIDSPANFIQTNILGTYTLLECCRQYWRQLNTTKKTNFRLLHVSTDEVYGDLKDGNSFFTETTPYAPSSPYSASKASADHLVRAWYRTYGLPIIITNCSNNYGPRQFPEKLIPLIIQKAIKGQPLPVYGNGQQVRDWLYVDDHAKALIKVLESGTLGQTYNIGGNNAIKNIDVVLSICEILDQLTPLTTTMSTVRKHSYLIQYVTDRPGHDTRYAIDTSKINSELGWLPEENFNSGLKKTINWYLSNQEWCADILNKIYGGQRLGILKDE